MVYLFYRYLFSQIILSKRSLKYEAAIKIKMNTTF